MSESMPERTVHLTEYFQVVWRRKLLVLSIWLAVFGAVTLYTYTRPQLYRAWATLLIERQVRLPQTLVGSVGEPTEEFYQTQYQLIRSRTVARKLFAEMNMANWEFFKRLKNRDKYEIVQNWIRITPHPKTHLVDVWVLQEDRLVAQEMVNKVTRFYLDEVTASRSQASELAVLSLTERVKFLEGEITRKQSDIRAHRQMYGIYSDREQINMLLGQMSQTIAAAAAAKQELMEAEAENAAVQEALSRGEPIITEMNRDYLNGLKSRIQQIEENWAVRQKLSTPWEIERDRMREIYETQKAQVEAAILAEQERLTKQRLSEVTQRLAQAKTNAERVQADLLDIEPQVKAYQYHEVELEGKMQQEALLRELLDALKKGAESLEVERGVDQTWAKVVDQADLPPEDSYYTPRYALNLSLGMVVGLLVGVAGSFFAEYLNTTIRLPSDIQQNLELPLLGFVPAIPPVVKSFENRGKIAYLASQSGSAEAYRSLRTELLLSCSPERPCRTVMVTSTNPREGKTTVASNLAITMAQAGYRVLLVDGDLRKPSIHGIFGLENDHGLSTLLSETGEARVYIKKTEVENLHVLPGGPTPVNPAELLGSRKMRTLMAETGERYDMVVVDGSPVLGVADANILATMVDGVILVIQASKAKRAHVIRARNQLRGVNARLVGAVLNNVRGSRGDYYYYRRYYNPAQIRGMSDLHA